MPTNAAAQTAFGPMTLAAVEHQLPPQHRLVDDDLAASFLPTGLRALVAATRIGWIRDGFLRSTERSAPGVWASIACRKRLIDDRVSDPTNDFDALVVLGAGFDTRAYRVARHSALPVFELDQQVNIDRKADVVRRVLGGQPESVRLLAVDLEQDDVWAALTAGGFDPRARTLFIAEGLTQYLSPAAVTTMLTRLAQAAPGSQLIFSYVRADFIDGTNRYGADGVYRRFREKAQVWQTGFAPERLGEILEDLGWRLSEQAGPSYYRDTYIRPTGRELTASPIEWTAVAQLNL
ncbi:SAM-dependent methyltransferase [Mycolicibacterium brumae]|uniref:S-adenosyl-L-methionine-dependent methyltransferase n=1 Tax=Mycolicibacterium brumae TaxID=85968 RepID=A0A2G5P5F3_9MYCO|nr:SAM-dependent methyltransferase [Mycolicibacterium brumae]MCV7193445.1 SAM-dependent methyltransferase [Mycolicibacterium brumae]PIB73134.1 SAM-dependent methyltransferase [Mycolicibacterium brumae]RWA17146.1 hypothetical protein MBRU_05850 [Mycolicibacterium brumae DSM 44177]UWW09282.1 SAM-dependent methyltransferase [Mycolicibacterium brumae]